MISASPTVCDRSQGSRYPRDERRMKTARVMFEVLTYLETNSVSTIDEIHSGIETRVCGRTIRRHLVALLALGAIESNKVDSRICYETTGRVTLAVSVAG